MLSGLWSSAPHVSYLTRHRYAFTRRERDMNMYDIARHITDDVFGEGTYAEMNKNHPDPGVQGTIRRIGHTKVDSLRSVLAVREQELLDIKGPCSNTTCRLHYAHSGPCEV